MLLFLAFVFVCCYCHCCNVFTYLFFLQVVYKKKREIVSPPSVIPAPLCYDLKVVTEILPKLTMGIKDQGRHCTALTYMLSWCKLIPTFLLFL